MPRSGTSSSMPFKLSLSLEDAPNLRLETRSRLTGRLKKSTVEGRRQIVSVGKGTFQPACRYISTGDCAKAKSKPASRSETFPEEKVEMVSKATRREDLVQLNSIRPPSGGCDDMRSNLERYPLLLAVSMATMTIVTTMLRAYCRLSSILFVPGPMQNLLGETQSGRTGTPEISVMAKAFREILTTDTSGNLGTKAYKRTHQDADKIMRGHQTLALPPVRNEKPRY